MSHRNPGYRANPASPYSRKTQYTICLAGCLSRTQKKFEQEVAHGDDGRADFWEAACICLEEQMRIVAQASDHDLFEENDGPWEMMVRYAKKQTGEKNYAKAIIAQAKRLRPVAVPKDEGNLVHIGNHR